MLTRRAFSLLPAKTSPAARASDRATLARTMPTMAPALRPPLPVKALSPASSSRPLYLYTRGIKQVSARCQGRTHAEVARQPYAAHQIRYWHAQHHPSQPQATHPHDGIAGPASRIDAEEEVLIYTWEMGGLRRWNVLPPVPQGEQAPQRIYGAVAGGREELGRDHSVWMHRCADLHLQIGHGEDMEAS